MPKLDSVCPMMPPLHPLQQRHHPEHNTYPIRSEYIASRDLQRAATASCCTCSCSCDATPTGVGAQTHIDAASFMHCSAKACLGPILQSLPAVRPAAARVVDRLPLVIQVTALHAPPDFIPPAQALISAQACKQRAQATSVCCQSTLTGTCTYHSAQRRPLVPETLTL